MSATAVRAEQIQSVKRADLDVITSGSAVAAKIIAGTGITLSSTGPDAGTGDVTVTNADGWTTVKVSGSDFTTTSTSLVDITGLSFTAAANTTYEIDCWLDVINAADTTGMKVGINSTGTSPLILAQVITNNSSTAALATTSIPLNNTATVAQVAASGAEGFIHITGYVKSGTGSPTISIRVSKVTSGTATVKVGSKLSYRIQ